MQHKGRVSYSVSKRPVPHAQSGTKWGEFEGPRAFSAPSAVPPPLPRRRSRSPAGGASRACPHPSAKPPPPSGASLSSSPPKPDSRARSRHRLPGRQGYGSAPLWEDVTRWRNVQTVRHIDRKPEAPECIKRNFTEKKTLQYHVSVCIYGTYPSGRGLSDGIAVAMYIKGVVSMLILCTISCVSPTVAM